MSGIERYAGCTSERLVEITDRFPEVRVAVLGDFFLDKYLDVDPKLAEVSLETGKIARQVVSIRQSPGAAGTVVSNLASLGASRILALGFVGADGEGVELRQGLMNLGCDVSFLQRSLVRRTPTYLKPRDVDSPGLRGEHPRYDIKNREWLPPEIEVRLLSGLERVLPEKVDAVIIADQVAEEDCGVVTGVVRRRLEMLAGRYPEVVFWVDSRNRIDRFHGMIIKPNQFEAVGWQNPPPEAKVNRSRLAAALRKLRRQTGAPVVITCGAEGVVVSDPEPTFVAALPVEGPTDPTGAGDSFTAGAVLALAAGASLPEAALVGNLVASITVQQLGTTGTARREELPDRLKLWLERHEKA